MTSSIHPLIAACGCHFVSLGLLVWSKNAVSRGKPAIPKHVAMLTGLVCFIIFLQTSLPLTTPARQGRSEYAQTNTALRNDLDHLQTDLDTLNSLVSAVLWVAFMVAIFPISDWLVERMSDRNWLHRGICPPSGMRAPEPANTDPA